MKKLLVTIFLMIFAISCSSLTAEERFEKGDYIGSLITTAQEIKKSKGIITEENHHKILNRARFIEKIYQDKLNNAFDDRSMAEANFDMWQIGYIIERNPELLSYVNKFSNINAGKHLNEAYFYVDRYVSQDSENRVRFLASMVDNMRNKNIISSQYSSIYSKFAKNLSDRYIDLAINYERFSKLEEAIKYYRAGYEAYNEFSGNYRNSKTKANELRKIVDLDKANKLFDNGRNLYDQRNYDRANSILEEARVIYSKYGVSSKVKDINLYLDAIKTKISEIEYNKHFNAAREYENHARRAQSYRDFKLEERYLLISLEEYKKSLSYSNSNGTYRLIQDKIEQIEIRLKKIR